MASTRSEPETRPGVLFVDDDQISLDALIRSLSRHRQDFRCQTASTRDEAFAQIKSEAPEVVVLDLELAPGEGPGAGLALIPEVLQLDDSIRVLVLTGHGSEEYGMEAVQRGAASFIAKPVEAPYLLALLDDAASSSKLCRKNRSLELQLLTSLPEAGLSSRNPVMQRILSELQFACSTTQPVLLLGETGTGKGVIAEAIHKLQRPEKPFVRAQPGFGSLDLIQSELFGHERGSFTGAAGERKGLVEEADGGTLFLDEIDALPPETQVMLLHVLQSQRFRRLGSNKERTSRFRLITASNCSLSSLKQRIRPDLFHRLSHLTLEIPPLRERKEDINLLASEFLHRISRREKLAVSLISPAALERLRAYDWPGNVRELQAVVEQAAFRAKYSGRSIAEPADISLTVANRIEAKTPFRERIEQVERELLSAALRESGHSLSGAARHLGLERSQFKRMLKRLGIAEIR